MTRKGSGTRRKKYRSQWRWNGRQGSHHAQVIKKLIQILKRRSGKKRKGGGLSEDQMKKLLPQYL